MDLKDKQLEILKSEKTLVDLYTDHFNESDYGYILEYTDVFLVLEKYDSDCHYDGLSVFFRTNISRIRWGGNDIGSVSTLIDQSQRLPEKPDLELTSIETVLRDVYAMYGHVTVHIQDLDTDVCFIGQIQEMDNESILIHEFGSKSTLDRKFILLSLDDITRVDAGGQYESSLLKLFDNK